MGAPDHWGVSCLAGLAAWVLISGLDDLLLDLVRAWLWARPPACPAGHGARPSPWIAVFVPLWQEHQVIAGMIEHNVEALGYDRYHIFIGVYPNDPLTRSVVVNLERRHPQVHMAECPHDGPTSKADCLNWIYLRMLLFEEQHGVSFDLVVTHDAEDLIHPQALDLASELAGEADMVQIPVLPLPTPSLELVHGVYCDEFADYQIRELPARQFLGGFLPSCGVGVAFSRRALEELAQRNSNRIFDPRCLTEDYEIGFRLHRMGRRAIFVLLQRREGGLLATREYFPRTFRGAVRQRTRWMMGIALQSWELHDCKETLGQLYWFWRDRKGLIGSLVSPATNAFFVYGLASGMDGAPWLGPVFSVTLVLQLLHLGIKMYCAGLIYGWRFAAGAPLRAWVGNAINFLAAACAIWRYAVAKLKGEPLVWLKTEHLYPSRSTLLSLRENLPSIELGLREIARGASRALPAAVARKWRVLPFRVSEGQLLVAGPELPSSEMAAELRRFCSLEVQFHCIALTDYAALEEQYMPRPDQRAVPLLQ